MVSTDFAESQMFKKTDNNAGYFIYPCGKMALKGSFDANGNLIQGQKVRVTSTGIRKNGMLELTFSQDLVDPAVKYHYKPPGFDSFGDQPTVPDEIAMEYVEVIDTKTSKVIKIVVFQTIYGHGSTLGSTFRGGGRV
jgi:hypothetical protein